jgi:hypothetical protein
MGERSRRRRAGWILWYVLTVALTGLLAAVSVFGRGPARTESYANFFGNWADSITVTTNGVFELHGAASTAERITWDALTLGVLVPVLLLVTPAAARGSLRARIVAIGGLIGIVLQQRAYLGTWALDSSIGLLSLLVLVMALIGSALIASVVDARSLADDLTLVSSRPIRPAATAGTAVLLMVLWLLFGWLLLRLAVPVLADVLPTSASIEWTFVGLPVSGWSIGTVVAAVAIQLWRRSVLGALLAPIFLVTTAFLGLGNVLMVVAAWVTDGSARPLELVVSLVVTAASGAGLWLADRRLLAAEAAAVGAW